MFLVKKILNIVNPKPSFFAFSRVVRKVVVPFFCSMSGEQHAVRYLRLLFSPTLNDAATCAHLCDKSGQIANKRYIKLPKFSYIGCVFLACTSRPADNDAKHEICHECLAPDRYSIPRFSFYLFRSLLSISMGARLKLIASADKYVTR